MSKPKREHKPKGFQLLKSPVVKKIGGWTELKYDASLERYGITWYRIQNGFGGNGDREDWVADVPSLCVSVSDYNWIKGSFGTYYGSFDKAIEAEITSALEEIISEKKCLKAQLKEAEVSEILIRKAIVKMEAR